MAGFSSRPSNYPFLQKLRKAKKATLKPCSFLKPTTQLRDYQVIGVLHLLSLARMILGDGVGLGKCVSTKTYIPTDKGLKKLIEFIPDNPKDDTFYPYSGDCQLLTVNGPVKPDAIYYCGVKDGFKIRTQKGYEIAGLPHHPLYAPVDSSFEYRRLDSFKIGDYVCINRNSLFTKDFFKISYTKDSVHTKPYTVPGYLTEDLAELLGFYISEGHSPGPYGFVITQHDPVTHKRIRELLFNIFGYAQNEDNTDFNKEIKVNSTEILNFFKCLGVNILAKSGDQIVPEAIFKSPASVISAFLKGYFEGDGSAEKSNKIVSCSSKSKELINQLQLLLLNFGVTCRRKIKMVKVKEDRRPYHILYFCGKDVQVFRDKIGFSSDRKNVVTQGICNKKRNTNRDIIPIGKEIIRQAVRDITEHLKSLPEHRGFSVKGSGWKGVAGYHLKRMLEEIIYKKKRLTYELLNIFIDKIQELNLTDVVGNYDVLIDIQEKNFFFDEIVSIESVKDTFADFHVPGEHNFTGNGFVNHNTLQMITAYVYRLITEPDLKLIVVTPKSAMEQWAEEFEKFCEGVSTHVLTNSYGEVRQKNALGKMESVEEYGKIEDLKAAGKKCRIISGFAARKAQYDTVKANVLIVNYFAVKEDYTFLIENRGPRFQIAYDECQEFKNMKTKTWFGANELSEAAKYCYGMSATIIKNRLEEAYFIYRVIVPGLFPGKNKFLAEYTIRKKMTRWDKGRKRYFNKVVGYTNLVQFKDTIDPFFLIRRTRDVAAELPQLISRKLILEMSESQEHLYRRALSGELYQSLIKERYFKFEQYVDSKVDDLTEKESNIYDTLKLKYEESLTKEGMAKNKIAALSYCQLVSNGPGWLNEDGESSKETEFRRLFDQELSDEKTIVFTRFKSGIKRLSAILNDLGLKHVQITGDDDIKQRNNSRKLFQDLESDYNVIFITQAGSAAINLQVAGVILYYDTPWSYGDLYQSIGRAQRIGSIREHILLLHMVNKKTIDEHVLDILDSKKGLINQIVGDIAEGAIEFKNDDVLFGEDESSVSALFDSVFSKVA
jgi:intein/homing endonuclease